MVLTRRPILARQDSGDTSQGQPCMGTCKRCVVDKNQPPLFWGMAGFHSSVRLMAGHALPFILSHGRIVRLVFIVLMGRAKKALHGILDVG